MLRVFVRILTDAVVVAVVLFVAAGTVAWPRAWLLLAVLLVVRMLSAILVFRFQPTLLLERATVLLHRDKPRRRHRLVSTGIYKVIRHPMYAGNPLVLVGMSLWLGSYIAALCAIVPLGLLIVRISLEERLLRRELADYGEYVKRVPYRLLPGIW